jgi:hypothetical protein
MMGSLGHVGLIRDLPWERYISQNVVFWGCEDSVFSMKRHRA